MIARCPIYSIGTILELVRTVATRLAEENLRVRICVQGSMGVGKKFRNVCGVLLKLCELTKSYYKEYLRVFQNL